MWVQIWTISVEFSSSSSIFIDIVDADQGQLVRMFPTSPVWNCESPTKRMKMDQPSHYNTLVQICQICVHRGVKKKWNLRIIEWVTSNYSLPLFGWFSLCSQIRELISLILYFRPTRYFWKLWKHYSRVTTVQYIKLDNERILIEGISINIYHIIYGYEYLKLRHPLCVCNNKLKINAGRTQLVY